MKLLYFARIREQIGFSSEERDIPSDIKTVFALISLLKSEGSHYDRAFSDMDAIRVAINRQHVASNSSLEGAQEIAFFPPMTGG